MLPTIDMPHFKFELPSTGETVTYRPFTVRERKVLLIALESGDDKDMIDAVQQIASNCVVDSKTKVSDFATFDMEYFFLQLKAKSISETTNLSYVCKNVVDDHPCDNRISIEYNLLGTKIVRDPEHTNKIPLTGNIGVVMKYPSASDKNLVGNGTNAVYQAFDMLANCIDYIWEGETIHYSKDSIKEEKIKFLEDLPDGDFKKIEHFFNTMPYVQDTLEFDCPKCKFHHKVVLEGLTSFFD